jgi:hypothetical protein
MSEQREQRRGEDREAEPQGQPVPTQSPPANPGQDEPALQEEREDREAAEASIQGLGDEEAEEVSALGLDDGDTDGDDEKAEEDAEEGEDEEEADDDDEDEEVADDDEEEEDNGVDKKIV